MGWHSARLSDGGLSRPTAKWIGATFALSVPGGWGYFCCTASSGLPRVERLLLFGGYFPCKNGYEARCKCRILLRNSMTEEFACPNCSSQSVVYPDDPDDDEYVVCRACGTVLATVAQFRRFVEGQLVPSGAPLSGC